jgi:hypothetical protein
VTDHGERHFRNSFVGAEVDMTEMGREIAGQLGHDQTMNI